MEVSSPELAALRARVEAYAFDRSDEAKPFTKRLCEQTGWSARRAARAIAEYRRFVIMAVAADHTVSPAHDVDEVWHLHLTETRRYWGEFCGEVLGKPLHHDPSRGGEDEDALYHALYLRTLDSYERLFDEPAPKDVWPRPRRSIVSRIRQALPTFTPRPSLLGLPALLFVAGCAVVDSSQPGAIQGPEFILEYLGLAVLGLIVVGLWQGSIMHRAGLGAPSAASLGSYELAWLAGGRQRVLETVMLQLAQKGSITFDEKGAKVVQAKALASDAPPVEAAVYDAVATGKFAGGKPVATALDQLQTRLAQMGLVPSKEQKSQAAGAAWLVIGAIEALGLVRLYFGATHHRPSGFLIFTVILLPIIAALMTGVRMRRNAQGKRVIAEAQAATPRTTGLTENDAALLRNLALFGATVIAVEAFGGYRTFVTNAFAGSGSSSSCSGGGGCSGGGCGGGCGG